MKGAKGKGQKPEEYEELQRIGFETGADGAREKIGAVYEDVGRSALGPPIYVVVSGKVSMTSSGDPRAGVWWASILHSGSKAGYQPSDRAQKQRSQF